MQETICSNLRAKVGESNLKSCSVTVIEQQRSTSIQARAARLNAEVAIQANDQNTAIDELVKISNEVIEEVPELAKNIEKSSAKEDASEEDASIDPVKTPSSSNGSTDESNDRSSVALLCFSTLLFLIQFIV